MSIEQLPIAFIPTYPVTEVSVTKAIVAATAHSVNDVLSESASAGTVWTFDAIARQNGGSGAITKVVALLETTGLTPRLVLYLFRVAPTSVLNDNVGNTAVLHADEANFIGWVELDSMETLGAGDSMAVATPSTNGNLPLEFNCASGDDALYGIVATRDGVTITATDDLIMKIFARQD